MGSILCFLLSMSPIGVSISICFADLEGPSIKVAFKQVYSCSLYSEIRLAASLIRQISTILVTSTLWSTSWMDKTSVHHIISTSKKGRNSGELSKCPFMNLSSNSPRKINIITSYNTSNQYDYIPSEHIIHRCHTQKICRYSPPDIYCKV